MQKNPTTPDNKSSNSSANDKDTLGQEPPKGNPQGTEPAAKDNTAKNRASTEKRTLSSSKQSKNAKEEMSGSSHRADFYFTRLLPNIATVAALCTGLSAIRFAMLDRFPEAVLAIIIAAFLDGIDGRIARLLNATSDFGAELDSLSDFISFGVAPAIVAYLASLHHFHGFGWGIILFYSVCMALRLARFNAMNIYKKGLDQKNLSPTISKGQSKFFVGVPAPAGAFISMSPLILDFASEASFFRTPYFYGVMLVLSGILMISRIPTYSFKSTKINRKYVVPLLITCVILVAGLVSIPWIVAAVLVGIYLLSIPASYLDFKRHRHVM